MSELARELAERIEGEVRFDRYSRILYSTDASIYQIEPIGVVVPRSAEDVARTVEAAARAKVPLLPRGGGTSLAGQAVGEAVVVDFSKYLHRLVELDVEEGWVRVEPGIVQDALGALLRPHGLRFGPETATSNRANIGGMIGNNSAGARSLVYGKTVDHVLEVRALLADGTEATFGAVSRAEAERRARGEGAEARIYRTALALAEEYRAEIEARYPRIPRRVSGYNLDELLDPNELNLAKLVVGSEGTLATVVEAKLRTVPLPPAAGLAVLHFDGLLPSLETAVEILDLGPSAVELVDKMVLDLARRSLEYSRRLGFVRGDPHALVIVEFSADTEEAVRAKLDELERRIGSRASAVVRVVDADAQQNVWKVRKAALPLLLGLPGDAKPIAFVEDTAVAPERLAEYIRRFQELLAAHETIGSFYAHAGAGCLHIRPLFNLKNGAEVEKMHRLARDVCELVLEFGGAMSGEHGDGLARSEFNRRIFGDRLYEAFRRLKAAFDPEGLMNPGKIVDAPPMTENLRYGPSYRTRALPVVFPYRREGGFARAVELCNGSGVCRKTREGTMCPSFMVTLEEEHSTRGRANALRAVLDGRLGVDELGGDRFFRVMELCIACKACKAECPSNVDMARLKAEFLHLHYRDRRRPLRDRLFVRADAAGRWGSRLAPVANRLVASRWIRGLLERIAGLDRRRSLPPFAPRRFDAWFAREHRPRVASPRRGRVVLFDDTFLRYYEPEVGIAATRLLEAAGYEVVLAPRRCCGRPAISKGFLDEARRLARENVAALYPYAARGDRIVGCEPSCLLTLRDELPDLAPGPEAEAVAAAAVLVEELFATVEPALPMPRAPARILAHGHCHEKALVGIDPLRRFLETTGAAVEIVDAGCCGMAGSFGYEKEHFDVSLRMGERRLLPAVRAAAPETVVVASGTSCRHQIRDATGRRALHPVEAVARAAGLVEG